jgi:hypothetical protein
VGVHGAEVVAGGTDTYEVDGALVDFQTTIHLDALTGVGADFAFGSLIGERVSEGHVAVGERFLEIVEFLSGFACWPGSLRW